MSFQPCGEILKIQFSYKNYKMSDFHKLTVKNINKETANAVSVLFDIPENLKSTFKFDAGQYITIKATINGEEIRRAYSICSTPKVAI